MNNTITINRYEPKTFEFAVDINDTMFTLARNVSFNANSINDVVSKMAIIKELNYVNVNNMSRILGHMNLKDLNIFSIDQNSTSDVININSIDEGSNIKYIEMASDNFIKYINIKNIDFSSYNKNSLYIIRNGSFIDIKNLFRLINDTHVNIGRWRWPKSTHIESFGS